VSKSSISLWVREMPRSPRLSYEENRRRSAEGSHRYWATERPVREALRATEVATAATAIGTLTDREILIAGAIAYWCEGAKRKTYRGTERVVFINSDPALIRFFLRFLATAGVSRSDLTFRVHIHESANVVAAEQFWLDFTGAAPSQFKKTTLKKHNPKTLRTNVGENYHGCLRIDVQRSRALYRKIEGWVSTSTASSALSAA
jgi:hypothetical protein